MAYDVEDIQCPSPDELRSLVGAESWPLVIRQQGATEVSCLVEFPHSYAFSLLSFKNNGQLRDSVLPILEEQSQTPSTRFDGRTTSSTVRPVDNLGDEGYELVTRFDDTNEIHEIVVWSRTGPYRVRVSGQFPDRDVARSVARLWVLSLIHI